MALTVEEVEAVLRLKDEMSAKLNKITGNMTSSFGGIMSLAKTVGGALGIAFTADALISFTSKTIEFAGRLDDLSKTTGISTDQLQRLGFAGKRVGLDMESVAAAVTQMSKRLAGGDDSAVAAADKLGLSVEDLINLKPDKAFINIGNAIGKIEDPMQRSRLAFELFGRTGTQLLPLMEKGLEDVLAAADKAGAVIGKDAVKALDDFGDKMGDIKLVVQSFAARALAPLINKFTELLMIGKDLNSKSAGFIDPKAQEQFEKYGAAVGAVKVDLSGFSTGVKIAAGAVDVLNVAHGEGLTRTQMFANRLKALREQALTPLTEAQQKQILELKEWGVSEKEIAELVGSTTSAVGLYIDKHKESVEATKKLNEEHIKLTGEVRKLEAGFYGVTESVGYTDERELKFIETTLATAKAVDEVEQKANIANFGFANMTENLGLVMVSMGMTEMQIGALNAAFGFTGPTLDMVAQKGRTAGETLHQAFADVGTILDNIGGKFAEIGAVVTRTGTAIMDNLAKGDIWGAVVAGAAGVITVFKKLFDDPEKRINPIREQFVQLHGGLGKLNQQAAEAGVTLTAMLSAKNPEQYKKAIDDLNNAFEFQKTAMETLNETVGRYGFTIEELGPAFARQKLTEQAQQLFKDFNVLVGGGIDVEAISIRMADAINDFVGKALRTGTEVPSAMKPMLQRMADMGLLIDQDGKAITDLGKSGLTFSETMSEGFTRVVDEVRKLTDAIARGLGLSLDQTLDRIAKIPDKIPIEIEYRDPGYHPSPGPEVPEPEEPETPEFRHGGTVRKTGLALVHAGETVVPAVGTASFSGASSSMVDVVAELRAVQRLLRNMPAVWQSMAAVGAR